MNEPVTTVICTRCRKTCATVRVPFHLGRNSTERRSVCCSAPVAAAPAEEVAA